MLRAERQRRPARPTVWTVGACPERTEQRRREAPNQSQRVQIVGARSAAISVQDDDYFIDERGASISALAGI
jgi:hypothetical protein